MSQIYIVTDSTCQLTTEEKERYRVITVPVNVMSEGKIYREGVDLNIEKAFQLLEKNPDDWATSAPSPGDFLAAFKKATSQGAEGIICLTLAQSISATWNSARNAKKIAKTEIPETKIEVIDSGTATVGETLLVQQIAKGIEEGKTLEELVKITEVLKEKIRVFLVLETIRYIYRSGRIPEVASKIGSLLPLKPILGIHGGKLGFEGAATSKSKSKEKVLDVLKNEYDPISEIALTHIDSPEEIEELKGRVASLLPNAKISIREFSPIIGYAIGRGTIGISFFVK